MCLACSKLSCDVHAGLHVLLKQSLPARLVRDAGAPAELWTEIISPPYSDNLFYDVIWVNKTPTRLPEVRCFSCGKRQNSVASAVIHCN